MLDWTARRYRISQLINSELQEKMINDRKQAYLTLNDQIITKVRVIGTVISKVTGENNYTGVKINDGSGAIFCKTWDGSFDSISEYDLIEVIGRLRVANLREGQETPDIYINPDLVITTNDDWELVHRLELLRNMPSSVTLETLSPPPRGNYIPEESFSSGKEENIPEKPINSQKTKKETPKAKKQVAVSNEGELSGRLENIIRDLDEGDGVSYETIADKVEGKEGEIDDALFKLLMDSKIYEPRPGRYRLIDS